jgi:hypothetical protein
MIEGWATTRRPRRLKDLALAMAGISERILAAIAGQERTCAR